MRRIRLLALPASLALAIIAPAKAGAGVESNAYANANRTEVCGYLPYRGAGPDRFQNARLAAATKATVGPQATYPFAWDLARPAFLAAEVADDLIAGRSVEAVRSARDASLSLGEYMLFAAKNFETAPTTPETEDERLLLSAERPANFHRLYAHAKASYDQAVAHITTGATPTTPLDRLAAAWRPAYALVAKAQADDKRIELVATSLDGDAIAEKEAVACLAHAVALLAATDNTPADAAETARAQASAARWATRPTVDARALPRQARSAFFDYEDAGDALAEAIANLPPGPPDIEALRSIAKTYATFVTAAKSLHDQTKSPTQ